MQWKYTAPRASRSPEDFVGTWGRNAAARSRGVVMAPAISSRRCRRAFPRWEGGTSPRAMLTVLQFLVSGFCSVLAILHERVHAFILGGLLGLGALGG